MKKSPLTVILGACALLLVVGFVLVKQRSVAPEPVPAPGAALPEVAAPVVSAPVPAPTPVVETTPPVTEPKASATTTSVVPAPQPVTSASRPQAAKELKTNSAHLFLDEEFGVGGEVPEGWTMRSSARWGVRQNTIWFSDPLVPSAVPSMYYKINEELTHRSPDEIRAWMYATAVEKERQRVAEGRSDYKNREEMTYHQIGDRPALTWSATYTRNGEPWVENLTRLYSPAGTVLFFLHAPASDIDAAQASFNTVIQSTVMPPPAPVP